MNPSSFMKGFFSFVVFAAIWIAVCTMGFDTMNQMLILFIAIPLVFSLIAGAISHLIQTKTKYYYLVSLAITAPFFIGVLNFVFRSFGSGGILSGI